MKLAILITTLWPLPLAGYQEVRAQTQNKYDGFDLVDKAGNIRKPADVRDLYQLLETYNLELNPKGGDACHLRFSWRSRVLPKGRRVR